MTRPLGTVCLAFASGRVHVVSGSDGMWRAQEEQLGNVAGSKILSKIEVQATTVSGFFSLVLHKSQSTAAGGRRKSSGRCACYGRKPG